MQHALLQLIVDHTPIHMPHERRFHSPSVAYEHHIIGMCGAGRLHGGAMIQPIQPPRQWPQAPTWLIAPRTAKIEPVFLLFQSLHL